jgi:hypothetical protein
MKLKDLICNLFHSSQVKHVSGQTFADIYSSLDRSSRPISVDGYIRKAKTDGFILFGESPRAERWIQISIRRIIELEHLGQEVARDRVCERVRLIL